MKQKLPRLTIIILAILLCNVSVFSERSIADSSEADKPLGDTKLFENTPLFESKKFHIAFIVSLFVTGTGVLIGSRGKSLKHHNSQDDQFDSDNVIAKIDGLSVDSDRVVKAVSQKEIELKAEILELEKLEKSTKAVDYQEIYQKLARLIISDRQLENNSDWEIDNWEVDVEIAIIFLSKSPDNFKGLEPILMQSNLIRQ